jgi:hypothetical protein
MSGHLPAVATIAAMAMTAPAAGGGTGRALDRAAIADALPRVDYAGGPFLRRPQLVTVTFAGDDPAIVKRLESFGAAIGRSSWWPAVLGEHCAAPDDCVGALAGARAIRSAMHFPSRVHAVDVETWLAEAASSGALGTVGLDTLALLYLPPGVLLHDAPGGAYCGAGARAYHRALMLPSGRLAFAVVPRCGDLVATTLSASHEIVEAVTNPEPERPGFRLTSSPRFAGFRAAGSEPADPCGPLFRTPAGSDTEVVALHAVWSNRAAAAGGDPCVPATPRPFVALMPREPIVRAPAGGRSIDVLLDARADRDTGGWRVEAKELAPAASPPALAVSLDRDTVAAGVVARLSIRVIGVLDGPRVVALVSTRDGIRSVWPLVVTPPR